MNERMGEIREKNYYIYPFLFCTLFVLSSLLKVSATCKESLNFTHYTVEDGLSSSYVKSIIQDTDGFIWTANRVAVSRFDGKEFREFPVYDQNNNPVKIFCDKLYLISDTLLVTRTIHDEYYYYDRNLECFFPYELLNRMAPFDELAASKAGIWVIKSDKFYFLDTQTGRSENAIQKLRLQQIPAKTRFLNVTESHGWLVFNTGTSLYGYNFEQKELKQYKLPFYDHLVLYDVMFVDSRNYLWISSFDVGVVKLNLENSEYEVFSEKEKGNFHLPHNFVHCCIEDHLGRIWIGTEAGLAIYEPVNEKLSIYIHNLADSNGLNTDPIYDAYCDYQGNVWLGTYFGGINFWSGEKKLFRNWPPGFGKWQLRGNVVSCLNEDKENNLWIGLEDKGLNKLNPETGDIVHYSSDNGLTYNNLHDLLFVDDNELWIATYTGGINVLDTKSNTFRYYNQSNTPELTTNDICMFEKLGDSVYIATYKGIVVYSVANREFSRLKPDVIGDIQFLSICKTGDILWFSSGTGIFQYIPKTNSLKIVNQFSEMQNINFVKADSRGRIWAGGCYKGLYCFDRKSGNVMHFSPENGFPSHWIFSLEEGNDGWFWTGTDKGLVKFKPETNKYILYDNNSGISFHQFNYRASFTDREGNIYFGGNNGMISFNKKAEPPLHKNLPIVFTGVRLFNELVKPGDLKYFDQSINKLDKLTLKYNQNIITIEFSAFNYSSRGDCLYSFFLEGFESDWNTAVNRNFATYTNLSPGTYNFKVKAFRSEGDSNIAERQLRIVILPPFWLTWWAYCIYAVIGFWGFIFVFRVGKNLEKTKARAEFEHQEKLHTDEIHRMKMDFFTNISHELKTPLTLILGPVNKILEKEKVNPSVRKGLSGVERNAKRLLQLINQLLEFRKIETGKEGLKVSLSNISRLVEGISESFNELAESQDISFQLQYQPNNYAWVDIDKVDKMIFNLLSNAFKFTPRGGKIVLDVEVREYSHVSVGSADLFIIVTDSGKGIPSEMLDKVFERFFQLDNAKNGGFGIGLAFVKTLVALHKGTIEVDSVVNKGTTFYIKIPAGKEDYSEKEFNTEPAQYLTYGEEFIEPEFVSPVRANSVDTDALSSKPQILIIEDNIELVEFIKESLEDNYRIVTAFNGLEAFEKLKSIMPDLIISDIMMPHMDGIEFTNRLKTDLNLSHIPVILLTSRTGVENKLEGLKSGADYYIEKPFYAGLLNQNIKNILKTRQNIIERFRKDETISVEEMVHSESDKIFIEKITHIIKLNISNPSLDVTYLTRELGVSRSLLHMKLKKLAGCSSTEFIRAIRLKEAVKLISSGKCNISEAAYETGFSSPTYFTRRFREFYGKSPSEYFSL